MKALKFPEVNVMIAVTQQQYETLPAHIYQAPIDDNGTTATAVVACFELDEEELKQVKETGKIWLRIITDGPDLQPIGMTLLKPTEFK